MAKRHHAKSKDKNVQNKLSLIAMSSERQLMPRPAVFKDKSKYDRRRQASETRRIAAAY